MLTSSGLSKKRSITITISGSSRKIIIFTSYRAHNSPQSIETILKSKVILNRRSYKRLTETEVMKI